MKKKIVTLCLVAALAVTAIGGTLAYFTDTEEATNTFTVGNVDIELKEDNWDEPDTVIPGETYAKDPVVNNIGANAAWVRVDVTISDAAAFMAAAENHNITDLATIFSGHDETAWTLAGTTADTKADTLTYSYYFNTLVPVDGTTGALFTEVEIPAEFTNEEMAALGDDFTIEVVAHAIQESEDYTTVADAFANYTAE